MVCAFCSLYENVITFLWLDNISLHVYTIVLVFQAAITKGNKLGGLNNRNCCIKFLGLEVRNKQSAGWFLLKTMRKDPLQPSLLGSQMVVVSFSLYGHCLLLPVYSVHSLCIVVVQSLSCVWLFATAWTAAYQASLSFTISGVCSNSCPLSQWCHPTISSSAALFSLCLQSFPVSGSFPLCMSISKFPTCKRIPFILD